MTHLGGPLDWMVEHEQNCSQSACKVEAKGMGSCTRMRMTFQLFLRDIDSLLIEQPTPILCAENEGGIKLTKSDAITEKMRHLDIQEATMCNN